MPLRRQVDDALPIGIGNQETAVLVGRNPARPVEMLLSLERLLVLTIQGKHMHYVLDVIRCLELSIGDSGIYGRAKVFLP